MGRLSEANILLYSILAVVFGHACGFSFRFLFNISIRTLYLIGFPGDIYTSMLQMLYIPLIVASVIPAFAALNFKSSVRVIIYASIYHITTTITAVVIGVLLVILIQPGSPLVKVMLGHGDMPKETDANSLDTFIDLIRNMFPDNIVQACILQRATKYVKKNITSKSNSSSYITVIKMAVFNKPSKNKLGLITFSLMIGIVLGTMGKKGRVLTEFFNILQIAVMKLTKGIIIISPIGFFFINFQKMLKVEELEFMFSILGLYVMTVVIGLFIHGGLVLNVVFYLLSNENPVFYLYRIMQALINAYGTASSSSTLPITFKCLEENVGLDKRITRILLPLGVTISMNGTALYVAISAIFIAQINNVCLSFEEVVTISVTSTVASMGAACVPNPHIFALCLVLVSVNLPVADVSLILLIDVFLNPARTIINVLSDAYGANMISTLCKNHMIAPRDKSEYL